MAAPRVQWQIVGRYMSGTEVTGYHLQSIETGKSGRFTRAQVCYLVGRNQITNCTGSLAKDGVILTGRGMNLASLPSVQENNGKLKNTGEGGRVKRGTSNGAAMEQFTLISSIKAGNRVLGYGVKNYGGAIKKLQLSVVLKLAQSGKINNARLQMWNGKPLLRGVGCNLNSLPVEKIQLASNV